MKKIGKQTYAIKSDVVIQDTFSIVGPKEGEGPLKDYFNIILDDCEWGEKSWEKSEQKFQKEAVQNLLKKNNIKPEKIDMVLSGDLLNQIITSSYAARSLAIPFIGLYGACSTMALTMAIGSMLIDGGFASNIVCATSSHFCTAERQYRAPLEMGGQRPLSSQWTVTGCGAVLLSNKGEGPKIKNVTLGKIIDLGVSDVNNMGAAMAPAAADTIKQNLLDTSGRIVYDEIVTGDLASIGKKITDEILRKDNIDIEKKHKDCGVLIFDPEKQDVHAGGSGCGCSAVVFSGYYYKLLKNKKIKNLLFAATGALHSPIICQQGESIPGISHAIGISS